MPRRPSLKADVHVRLPEKIARELAEAAAERGIGASTLARIMIINAISKLPTARKK